MTKPLSRSVEDMTRIVIAVLRAEVTIAEVVRREGVSQTSVAKWRDRFLEAGHGALVVCLSISAPAGQPRFDPPELSRFVGRPRHQIRDTRGAGSRAGLSSPDQRLPQTAQRLHTSPRTPRSPTTRTGTNPLRTSAKMGTTTTQNRMTLKRAKVSGQSTSPCRMSARPANPTSDPPKS